MHIISNRESLINKLAELKKKEFSIGFVATMGALHEGHLQLIKRAKQENDMVVCSIFVNPLQFNNQNDFNKYPNTIEEDKNQLRLSNCDLLFLPSRKDIFPVEPNLDYNFPQSTNTMEGEHRPGHFKGMAAVVEAFFRLIEPHKAYFGEKDYQQYALIKWLAKEKDLGVDVIPCSTYRNDLGLAMSSRNLRLTKNEIKIASKLYEMMIFCKSNQQYNPEKLIKLAKEALRHEFEVEYIFLADEVTLKPIESWSDSAFPRVFVAANLSGVRLIDNLSLID